ncbi:MAG: diphthamide biosynthesis enzyme Dph2 [Methanomassiliicoccales archaeon]|nr:diphthamide biosynthesis enzyme Dph2 [Methanomassiliicoccales archaeon]
MYDFKFDIVAKWINGRNARSVALQMPEGLKIYSQFIAEELGKRTNAAMLIIADPCYGACDIARDFSDFADVLVHFGHTEIPTLAYDDRILFVEIGADIHYQSHLVELLPKLENRVGLIATIPFLGELEKIKKWLEENGKQVFIGRRKGRAKYDGQVLGCDISAAKDISEVVDQFLFIGNGDFHPLAVSIETKKEVIIFDPITQQVRDLADLPERILRQRHAAISKASTAKKFLILVSTKIGQNRLELAMHLKEEAREHGRKADVVVMNEFNPDLLMPFEADAYVSTACPRLAIDDFLRYPKPILTPIEFEIAIGIRRWSDYHLDSF